MFSSTACSTTTGRYASKATEPPASSLVLAQTAGPAELSEVAITEITKQNGEILAAIADSQVIYLGETHNSTADHAAQLDIIQARASETDIAIGLEMFQRPFQPVLDSYLTGDITEAELIEQSEYETRWGYDWEFYAPILRYAKANQIPLIALNTPTEVTRQVAREGLKSLSGDALTYIPPVDEIDTTDEDYQASIADVFNAHGGAGHSLSFENFFAAQVLWDETMAEAIVTQLASEPNRQIIALVGEGHIAYDYGIPNRVARRVPDVEQASIRLQPAGKEVDPEFADYTWPTLER
ncbi:MAG: ChaN family lipoprotein [Cyanobacteria bacterium J06632_3]